MREEIRKEVESIMAFDSLERDTLREVLDWIDSGAELCRVAKPAIPAKHLVSYFAVVDGDHLLLVDHIKAERWLPTGGHVEPNEHPRDTVLREVREELGIAGSFLLDRPVLITSTETVGKTAGHTDISIWYALKGDRSGRIRIDKTEFHEARWFRNDDLPANSDPHLPRFVEKLYAEILLGSQQDD